MDEPTRKYLVEQNESIQKSFDKAKADIRFNLKCILSLGTLVVLCNIVWTILLII